MLEIIANNHVTVMNYHCTLDVFISQSTNSKQVVYPLGLVKKNRKLMESALKII